MQRTRIGVLVPAGNSIHEQEFAALRAGAPAQSAARGIEFSFRSFTYPPAGVADFCTALFECFAAPMAALRAWGADVVLIGCTAASMRCATTEHDATLEAMAGVPVVTAARATQEALAALALEDVVIATPYGAASNAIVREFVMSLGVRVLAIEGFGYDVDAETWKSEVPRVDGERGCAFAMQIEAHAATSLADSVTVRGAYFPCTGMASVDAIARYESRTGRIGLSSVLAGYWAALGRAGIADVRADGPQLLRRSGTMRLR